MTPLNKFIAGVRERLDKATPGLKEVIRFDNDSGEIDYQVAGGKPYVILCQFGDFENPKAKADAHLLANAPTDLTTALKVIEILEKQRNRWIHIAQLNDISMPSKIILEVKEQGEIREAQAEIDRLLNENKGE